MVLHTVEREIAGRTLRIETGRIAKQADGAVLLTYGDTVVLVTAVAKYLKEPPPFLPLLVEYREKQYAAGKFPGGIFKREGRPTAKETLTMRLIDRPIRPLFPDGYYDIQVIGTVLSADDENDPDVLALIGASAALTISDIPWNGPIGACRVGLVNDEFVINTTYEQRERSEADLVVSATSQKIVMVEGRADIIPEDDMITAMKCGQDICAEIVDLIEELAVKCRKPKRAVEAPPEVVPREEELRAQYYDRLAQAHRNAEKLLRQTALRDLRDEAIEKFCSADDLETPTESDVKCLFDKMEGEITREQILKEGIRYDGRGPKELRRIDCEVSILPRTHGSAIFTRGETQALVITTLGTVSDEQRVLDPLTEEPPKKKFMLHYNFPPFCVGEVRPVRGPGRREIGHGELAERALKGILPDPDEFPYTIRLVSDIMESNGSSSMATVCGGTLSMMDAGIPIKDPVAGISMGLVLDGDKARILTDIAGAEDHFGDMDFKVAGTQNGITALQLDVDTEGGVSLEILREAITQAREARLEILRQMLGVLNRPRPELSAYAPTLRQIRIDPSQIGLVIGPGGRTIRGLETEYGCTIEVENDGRVMISSPRGGRADEAADYIESLTREVKPGETYDGVVTELKDFGAIVELFPGTDGLCHVSQLDEGYVKDVRDFCKVGDPMCVKVLSVEGNSVRLSRKAALQDGKES